MYSIPMPMPSHHALVQSHVAFEDLGSLGAPLRSAADEVHDLQAVTGGDGGVGPARALDDLAVVLDGNAVALESHRGNHMSERDWRSEIVKAAVLAVDDERKGHNLLA